MNRRYWLSGKISDDQFMAKLAEEFGEVARARTAIQRIRFNTRNPLKGGLKAKTRNLIEELDHVEFMARAWRMKVEADLRAVEQMALDMKVKV